MEKFEKYNGLLLFIFFLIQFIKQNLCVKYEVTEIDPPHIKIESLASDKPKYITLIFNQSFTDQEREKQTLILMSSNGQIINCPAVEDKIQDEYNNNKTIFQLDQNIFLNKTRNYGKYYLYGINSIVDNNLIFNGTILIFLNYIGFKNPIHAYELTSENNNIIQIRYEFAYEIQKEYIYKITYIDDLNLNNEIELDSNKYILDLNQNNLYLIISFEKQNTPKNYTFYIYPEYDKNAEKSDLPKVYLHFQDYILLTDAIYIRRNNIQRSLVYFKTQFRNESMKNTFSINDNSGIQKFNCDNLICDQLICRCNFYLGYKTQPGKLTIEYIPKIASSITQKRDIFLILYETSISKCNKKNDNKDLEITTYWSSEMEYEQFLYFNDTARKDISKDISNKYKAKSSSLNSGTFSIYSLIPKLTTNIDSSTNINPVDDYSLYLTIYPGTPLNDYNTNTIYTRNRSEQIIEINSPNAAALDEITLKKISNNGYQIKISKSNGQCKLTSENIFTCNLGNMIYNYGQQYEGNYYVYYKSPCDLDDLLIEGRIIIIERGTNLIGLTPTYAFQNEVIGKEISLQYDNGIGGKLQYIAVNFVKDNQEILSEHITNPIINNDLVIIKITKNLPSGIYCFRTKLKNNPYFDNYNITFRVIPKIKDFSFNHHYFVLNNNAQINRLIINVNDNTNTFGCMIEEATRNKNLTHDDGNCKTFYYDIYRTGQIYFNYYYNDTNEKILIPINDNITVVSTYSSFFDFPSLRNCYYYKYNISIMFYNKLPECFVFLYNSFRNISLIPYQENSYTKYTYNSTEIDTEYIVNNEYFLIVSEGYEDSDTYLYKSKIAIGFTNISVPEFIIKPNITITFKNIFCNLNESKIEMKKITENSLSRQISDCKHNSNNRVLTCQIKYDYFYNNNPFNYYSYTIENENILDDQNNNQLTFASNKLSDSSFKCDFVYKGTNSININIININHDFYLDLLSEVGYYIITNGKNDSEIKLLQRKDNLKEFNINESAYSINFLVGNGNFDLDINYIKRTNYSWEGNMGLSIYHFFNDDENHIFNNTIFTVEPTLFIYHDYSLQKDSFKLNITFTNQALSFIYNANTFENLKSCHYLQINDSYINYYYYECVVNTDSLNKNQAQTFTVKIKQNNVDLDFIYYSLDSNSKNCKTKNEQIGDVTLLIYIPDPKYKDLIDLNSESHTTIKDIQKTNNLLSFTLNANEINLLSPYFRIITLGNQNIYERFSLKDLGLDIIPIYNMRIMNNEKSIIFMPENNQYLTLDINVKEDYIINPTDIKSLGINNHKFEDFKINGNTINVTLDLSWVKNEKIKEYQLFYIDRCGTTTYTDINITVASFTFQRHYFVMDNNLEDMKTQRLIIYGPYNDYIRIYAYKDGSENGILANYNASDKTYYIEFDQSSRGVYSFKIFSTGVELSKIEDKVYVANKLEEFFNYEDVPTCLYLDKDKKSIEDISYSISINDVNKINNISIFKSIYINSNNKRINLAERPLTNKKTFILEKSNNLKEIISTSIENYLYLTENDFIDQPIYVFKFKYTSISLNSVFSKVIYTDARYISFDMSCEIDKFGAFYLKSNINPDYEIQCEKNSYFIEGSKIYRCELNLIDKNKNPLLKYGDSLNDFGYHNITYDNNRYLINEKPFYLSYEIENADFTMHKEKQIDINEYTEVNMTLGNKIFYLPNTEKVTLIDDKGRNNPINVDNIKYVFEDKSKYLTFQIYIEHKHIYIINEICRIPCEYCSKSDCWNNPNKFNVSSNTKNIIFNFNRKFISYNDSVDENGNKNTELVVDLEGEDRDKLINLKYIYFPLDNGKIITGNLIRADTYRLTANNLPPGKYEFNYTAQEVGEPEEEFILKNRYVLVANFDYEIFNLTELYKSCLYYNDKDGELYTSLKANSSYKFKDFVFDSDIIIRVDNIDFDYSQNMYKKAPTNELKNNNRYKVKLKEKGFANSRLFFSVIYRDIYVTSFDLNSGIPYFYKDNIVTMNQTCYLDNIYIREIDSHSRYYRLDCKYNTVYSKSNCIANYNFTERKSNIFEFFIGFPNITNYIPLNKSKLIYNAIKDSTFYLDYKEPNLSIYSYDFNMSHINHVLIDEDIYIYSDNFTESSDDSIKFYFNKSPFINENEMNFNKSYVRELERIAHPEDIISVIKKKSVELEIVERVCDDLLIKYYDTCITCEAFSRTGNGANIKKIWYENGKCVEQCNYNEKYYFASVENHICSKCDTYTKINDTFILCGCDIDGVVRSYKDGNCYLPDSNEIKELLIDKPNAQCYLENGEIHNYCSKNNHTTECRPSSSSGALFPECFCEPGYTGKYCELEEGNIDLEEKMDKIISYNIDENSPIVISNIRGIIFFLEKDGPEYIKNISDTSRNYYIDKSYNKLKNIVDFTKKTVPQIYDVLEMAIYFLKYKINNQKSTRNLQEDEDIKKLNYIFNHLHFANYYSNQDYGQLYNIQADGLNQASFLTYKKSLVNSDDFKIDLYNRTLFKIMEYIDIKEASDDDYIFATLVNNDVTTGNNDLNIQVYFSVKNSTINSNLDGLRNITFYISSSYIDFNFQLAQYYLDRKISIYDKKDKAFVEPCYLSKLFDYDLTQKYRKNNVFQKRYYGSENCKLVSFEHRFNRLKFDCDRFDYIIEDTDLSYGNISIKINKDSIDKANKVYNLPTKCTRKIDDISGNMAFWIFLIISILEIIYIIGINILNLGSLKKISYRKGLMNDELFAYIQKDDCENDIVSNNLKLKPRNIKNDVRISQYETEDYIQERDDIFMKNLLDCIVLNFLELHPLAALFHVSIICPLIVSSWFFVFNSLTLFGFNALLYYEGLIEKRIYDKKRQNFDYPMRKEFHKIILSILYQVALTVLIRFIILVTLDQRKGLKKGLKKFALDRCGGINDGITQRIEQFQKDMLLFRILGGILMLFIFIFFFYYSVAFCGIYIKTQINWFYSGIWSLIWNWFILSPIYIVVISFLEHMKKNSYDPLVYYLKRLFCF